MTEESEEPDGSEDERPDVDEDEIADLDLGVNPEDVEEETSESDEESGDSPDDSGDESGDESGTVSMATPDESGPSGGYGEMYVKGLATTATVIKREAGNGGKADPELAYDIGLDRHFNEFVREKGIGEDMPPGQAVLIGTCLFLFAEVGTDEKVMATVMGEVSGGD